jgi:SSS family solute:Na+ symporter
MFYRRANSNGAMISILLSIPLSVLFKVLIPDLPFLDRMALIFLISAAVMIITPMFGGKKKTETTAATKEGLISDFRLRNGMAIVVIVTGLATAIRLILQPIDAYPGVNGSVGVPAWTAYVFLALSLIVIGLIYTDKTEDDHKAIDLEPSLFRTRMIFNISAVAIILILAGIYASFP